jgi:hypothetical protein
MPLQVLTISTAKSFALSSIMLSAISFAALSFPTKEAKLPLRVSFYQLNWRNAPAKLTLCVS